MTDSEAIAALTQVLHRINRNLEMIFGIPDVDAQSELGKQVQEFTNENKGSFKGIAVWCATDGSGQTYLCVRRGFMQPITSFPVEDVESARAFLSGVARSNAR